MTDYAERMLYIKCGKSLFYVGQIRGTARDPKNVKSPLELELWRVRRRDCTISCELRCDANGWDVPFEQTVARYSRDAVPVKTRHGTARMA